MYCVMKFFFGIEKEKCFFSPHKIREAVHQELKISTIASNIQESNARSFIQMKYTRLLLKIILSPGA